MYVIKLLQLFKNKKNKYIYTVHYKKYVNLFILERQRLSTTTVGPSGAYNSKNIYFFRKILFFNNLVLCKKNVYFQ